MTLEQGLLYLAVLLVLLVVTFLVIFVVPKLGHNKLSSGSCAALKGRGGTMDWFAKTVTLALGRLTFAVLHLFEKLGVDMADIDQAIAGFTSWGQGWKAQAEAEKARADAAEAALGDAAAAAQAAADALAQFQADDAATDASQLAAQAQADADKVQAALDGVLAADVPPAPPADPPADPVV